MIWAYFRVLPETKTSDEIVIHNRALSNSGEEEKFSSSEESTESGRYKT